MTATVSTTVAPNGIATRPAPGIWAIDPGHTSAGFVARHLMVSKVRGRFAEVNGTVTVAERPEDSTAEITINTASIDTGGADRDTHLRSPDFFDVERYPAITFRSTKLRELDGGDFVLDGELTVRDVTKPVSLKATFEGLARDPWGGERAGFTASTEVNREDWGLNWNVALEAGGVLVGKKITIELDVELVKQ